MSSEQPALMESSNLLWPSAFIPCLHCQTWTWLLCSVAAPEGPSHQVM